VNDHFANSLANENGYWINTKKNNRSLLNWNIVVPASRCADFVRLFFLMNF